MIHIPNYQYTNIELLTLFVSELLLFVIQLF